MIQVDFFTEIVPGNTSVGGVKRKRIAEYSDFGPIELGYISETAQYSPNRCVILSNSTDFGADYVKVIEDTRQFLQQKCRPNNVVFSDISLTVILTGNHDSESVKVRHSPLASENLTIIIKATVIPGNRGPPKFPAKIPGNF